MFSSIVKNIHKPSARVLGSSLTAPVVAGPYLEFIRTATKKAGGTVVNKSDSAGRRLGVKKYGCEKVVLGNIIIRQRGFKFHPGYNVIAGKDHTLHAYKDGFVRFTRIPMPGKTRNKFRTYVSVVPTLHPRQPELSLHLAKIQQKMAESNEWREEQKRQIRLKKDRDGPGNFFISTSPRT